MEHKLTISESRDASVIRLGYRVEGECSCNGLGQPFLYADDHLPMRQRRKHYRAMSEAGVREKFEEHVKAAGSENQ